MHTWSSYQQDIFDDAASGGGHTVVEARAGTGKTTTIVEALRHVPKGSKVTMVAFNRAIAKELGERAPDGVRVSTLHSLGYGAVRYAFKGVQVEEGKARRLLVERFPGAPSKLRIAACRCASLAKAHLTPADVPSVDFLLDRMWVADMDKDERALVLSMVMHLLIAGQDVTGTGGSIDFDDMVWLPAVLNLTMFRNDRLFVDEAQDLNAAQHWLVEHSVDKWGRLCAIGDARQAIYQFRGAAGNSMGLLRDHFHARSLPLSITYRCPKLVVAAVQYIVPDFTAADEAPEGIVEDATTDRMLAEAQAGDFILSRTNAPLIHWCLELLKQQKRATILGRNIGKSIVSLIDKSGADDAEALREYVREWCSDEAGRILARDPEADVGHLYDRRDCILAISEGCTTTGEAKDRAVSLFEEGDPVDRITLSSTHKAKGLERDRVWMLRGTYLRSKAEAEKNLFYVACTRSKRELYFVNEVTP